MPLYREVLINFESFHLAMLKELKKGTTKVFKLKEEYFK